MIGAAIGAGVGLATSLFGGIQAANQRRKMNKYLNQQDTENQAWYNANTLGDYTQRSEVQNLMRTLRDNLGKQNKIAANTAVVTGATPEAQAVQKEQSNKVIINTMANVGAMGDQWKERIGDRYMARKNMLANQRMGMMNDSAASYENLMNTGLNTLAGSAGGLLPASTTLSAPIQATVSNPQATLAQVTPSVNPSQIALRNPYK